MSDEFDPLEGGEKSPAMSFKDAPLGTTHYIDVSEPGKMLQQRDFDNDEPAYWPNPDGSKGNPKMAAVYNGVGEDGENLSLWAPKPSDLFTKLAAAQKAYGSRIGAGANIDRIYVRLADRVPAKNPKFSKSVYDVRIAQQGAKVTAPAEADPFSDAPPF